MTEYHFWGAEAEGEKSAWENGRYVVKDGASFSVKARFPSYVSANNEDHFIVKAKVYKLNADDNISMKLTIAGKEVGAQWAIDA